MRPSTNESLDLQAEVTALRDMAVNPGDLGLLFAMVPGLPPTYAERFQACSTWREVSLTLDMLLDYCERHSITVVL